DRDEWLVAKGTGIVNGAGDNLFAGSASTKNRNGGHPVGALAADGQGLFHLGGAADDTAESLLGLHLLAQQTVLRLELQVGGHTLQQKLQFVEAERLSHIVIGAILHGLHRRLYS